MDFTIWCIFATLLAAVQAMQIDQGPQVFSEGNPAPKKQNKRQQQYEMKEVILYLTPTQIRAFEAGQGLIEPQHGGQPDITPLKQQIAEQIQNALNSEGQNKQSQMEKALDANRKQRLQLPEQAQNTPDKQQDQLTPENNAPHTQQLDLQKREKFMQLQLQLLPPHQLQLAQHGINPQLEPPFITSAEPQFQPPFILPHVPQIEPQLIPDTIPQDALPQAALPQIEPLNLYQDKKQWRPQSYAYLHFYPKGKPIHTQNLHVFHPGIQGELPKQFIPSENIPILPFHPNFQLVPYNYSLQNKLEAQHILQTQLNEHHLDSHRLQEHQLESHQLENVDIQQFLAEKQLEPQFLYPRPHEAHEQVQLQEEAVQEHKHLEYKQEPKNQQLEAQHQFEMGLQAMVQQQMKEVEEAQKLKKKIEAQEKEAHRLDAQLEEEQRKAEEMKRENEQIEYLKTIMELEPKRTKMHSILKPLFQGHNIAESLEQQKKNFPRHMIPYEHGFRPLQYAPKFNDEKYARELEKMLERNLLAKQKAFEKAAAIANEPPEIIHNEKQLTKRRPVEIIKHVTVPMPTPVFVPVPEPFEVKVPQPYPVPLEIVRPIPVPIVKTEKVEVEKPVPIEIEKRVPFPVTKKVYIKVDKPYFVHKVVPAEVKKEIPVEIPIVKPQKLSLIRHVWET